MRTDALFCSLSPQRMAGVLHDNLHPVELFAQPIFMTSERNAPCGSGKKYEHYPFSELSGHAVADRLRATIKAFGRLPCLFHAEAFGVAHAI